MIINQEIPQEIGFEVLPEASSASHSSETDDWTLSIFSGPYRGPWALAMGSPEADERERVNDKDRHLIDHLEKSTGQWR
jgi:hypothetical protein